MVVRDSVSVGRTLAALAWWTWMTATATAARARIRASMPMIISEVEAKGSELARESSLVEDVVSMTRGTQGLIMVARSD
jgi:hypothetical protein